MAMLSDGNQKLWLASNFKAAQVLRQSIT